MSMTISNLQQFFLDLNLKQSLIPSKSIKSSFTRNPNRVQHPDARVGFQLVEVELVAARFVSKGRTIHLVASNRPISD